jgi:hypothetical protein
MTKTSTPTNTVSFTETKAEEKTAEGADQLDELFYNSIKSQLNELVRNPSDETINKILTYGKKK